MTIVTTTARIAFGRTSPGEGWEKNLKGVYLKVDTTSAKFGDTPIYVISLGGLGGNMWESSGGASSVYSPTATGFGVNILNIDKTDLSLEKVTKEWRWYVSWIGIEGIRDS